MPDFTTTSVKYYGMNESVAGFVFLSASNANFIAELTLRVWSMTRIG